MNQILNAQLIISATIIVAVSSATAFAARKAITNDTLTLNSERFPRWTLHVDDINIVISSGAHLYSKYRRLPMNPSLDYKEKFEFLKSSGSDVYQYDQRRDIVHRIHYAEEAQCVFRQEEELVTAMNDPSYSELKKRHDLRRAHIHLIFTDNKDHGKEVDHSVRMTPFDSMKIRPGSELNLSPVFITNTKSQKDESNTCLYLPSEDIVTKVKQFLSANTPVEEHTMARSNRKPSRSRPWYDVNGRKVANPFWSWSAK